MKDATRKVGSEQPVRPSDHEIVGTLDVAHAGLSDAHRYLTQFGAVFAWMRQSPPPDLQAVAGLLHYVALDWANGIDCVRESVSETMEALDRCTEAGDP